MAMFLDSTTAPVVQTGLLRAFTGSCPIPSAEPLSAAESTARQPCGVSRLTQKEALASTAAKPLFRPADHARALHLRRELHHAIDHGFALLDALDLPPLALDIIDDAIATMDALEAPDEDREPWLAGVCDLAFVDGAPALDAEGDSEEDEGTALESFGRGFVRAGADDAEESDEPEGDGGEPYLSVVEFDGHGDNWGRSGHATSGLETDVEDVNEGGCGVYDAPWWERPPAVSEAVHV